MSDIGTQLIELAEKYRSVKAQLDFIQTLPLGGGGGIVPAAHAYNDANISIPNNSLTVLTFNSEWFDTDTIHDTVTNTGRLTCKTAGLYIITASVAFAANATGVRSLTIQINGSGVDLATFRISASSAGKTKISIATPPCNLAVNDYVEALAYQDRGSALNVDYEANNSPVFGMAYIGAAN